MTSLMSSGDAPPARCAICGMPAAGPCARCRALVCADCCELTGGASPFALCTRCVRKGGTSLAPAWRPLLLWLAAIVVGLAGVAVLLALVR
jgi:hypothetical protein